MSTPQTLFDKIWQNHLVNVQEDGTCLLYIDRHLVHEVTSPQAFEGLRNAGRSVRPLARVRRNLGDAAEQRRLRAARDRRYALVLPAAGAGDLVPIRRPRRAPILRDRLLEYMWTMHTEVRSEARARQTSWRWPAEK